MPYICPYCGEEIEDGETREYGSGVFVDCPACKNVVKISMKEEAIGIVTVEKPEGVPDESWDTKDIYRWLKDKGVDVKWPISKKKALELVKSTL